METRATAMPRDEALLQLAASTRKLGMRKGCYRVTRCKGNGKAYGEIALSVVEETKKIKFGVDDTHASCNGKRAMCTQYASLTALDDGRVASNGSKPFKFGHTKLGPIRDDFQEEIQDLSQNISIRHYSTFRRIAKMTMYPAKW